MGIQEDLIHQVFMAQVVLEVLVDSVVDLAEVDSIHEESQAGVSNIWTLIIKKFN